MVRNVTPSRRPAVSTMLHDDARSSDRPAAGLNTPTLESERQLLLAFAPLHKSALGAACGVATALLVVLLTLLTLAHAPAQRFPLHLLSTYFQGYDLTVPGIIIGAGWGFVVGFVAGWFFAFCRNLAVAFSVFAIRTRAELLETRDFLDHI